MSSLAARRDEAGGEPGVRRRERHEDFEALHRRYLGRVVLYLRMRGTDEGTAEDLAQETLLRAYQNLDQLDPSRPVWPWLRAVARNAATDRYRHDLLQVPATLVDGASLDECADPDDGTEFAERLGTRALLVELLQRLPPPLRIIVTLRALHDWPFARIAEAVGRSEGSCRQLFRRGCRYLRRDWERFESAERFRVAVWPLGALVARLRWRWLRWREPASQPGLGFATEATTQLVLVVAVVVASLLAADSSALELPAQPASPAVTAAPASNSPAVETGDGTAAPAVGASAVASTAPAEPAGSGATRGVAVGATAPPTDVAPDLTARVVAGVERTDEDDSLNSRLQARLGRDRHEDDVIVEAAPWVRCEGAGTREACDSLDALP